MLHELEHDYEEYENHAEVEPNDQLRLELSQPDGEPIYLEVFPN